MFRRVLTAVAIAALIAAVIVVPGAAVAKKKKKPFIPGAYNGATNEGIPMSVTVTRGGSGTFTYCDAVGVPFTLSGRSFTVSTLNPDGTVQISADGTFGKNGTVSGSIPLGGGCTASAQTFFIKH
jgi:hypothetical protein